MFTFTETSSILSPFQNVTGVNAAPQEDFSELPPNQRRKKLQAKIDELTAKISQVCYQHHYVTLPLDIRDNIYVFAGDGSSRRFDEDEDSL